MSKTTIIERKYGNIKRVIDRLQVDKTEFMEVEVIRSTNLFAIILVGYNILSELKLAKGYFTSVIGRRKRSVTETILRSQP